MRLLIDTNVILDVLLHREPFCTSAEEVLALPGVEKYLSASAVTDVYYIAYRQIKNRDVVRELLGRVLKTVKIATVTGDDIHAAFALNWKDFEDSVQFAVADANKFDGIVTRNMEGFADDEVKIFTPEEVCRHVENCLKE